MRLRQPVKDTPEAIRAGVLLGLVTGLCAALMGSLHLEHLLPTVARFVAFLAGFFGMGASVLCAEICRRHGGRWNRDAWFGGFVFAGLLVLPLILADLLLWKH